MLIHLGTCIIQLMAIVIDRFNQFGKKKERKTGDECVIAEQFNRRLLFDQKIEI